MEDIVTKYTTNMERKKVFETLNTLFREVLDNDDIFLTEETKAEDIEEWDSLSHIQLIVAIEKEFDVKFTSKEIMEWNNVGDMVDKIVYEKQ